MKNVSIHDAKTNLSKYIAAAKKGEPIYIGSFGKPEVQLIRVTDAPHQNADRKLGIAKEHIWIAPDAFSTAADKEIATLLYGESKFRSQDA